MATFILVLILLYWFIYRFNHQRLVTERHKYAFYAFRDKIRWAAIEGKIDVDSWLFEYLDSSVSKTISNLETINLFSIVSLGIIHRRDPGLDSFRKKVAKELKGNDEGKKLFNEYGEMCIAYVVDKSLTTRVLFMFGVNSLLKSIKIYSWLQKNIRNVRVFPETSISGGVC